MSLTEKKGLLSVPKFLMIVLSTCEVLVSTMWVGTVEEGPVVAHNDGLMTAKGRWWMSLRPEH